MLRKRGSDCALGTAIDPKKVTFEVLSKTAINKGVQGVTKERLRSAVSCAVSCDFQTKSFLSVLKEQQFATGLLQDGKVDGNGKNFTGRF